MKSKASLFRRRNYLIHPKFQFALMGAQAGVLMLVLGSIGVQIWRAYARLNEMGRAVNLPENHAYFEFVSYQSSLVYGYLLVGLLGGFVLSAGITLWVSHRLAGPLVRLKGFFTEISHTGRVNTLNFRKGDYLVDLPPIINDALSKIEKNKKTEIKKAS